MKFQLFIINLRKKYRAYWKRETGLGFKIYIYAYVVLFKVLLHFSIYLK